MSRKFRFTGESLDRVREYMGQGVKKGSRPEYMPPVQDAVKAPEEAPDEKITETPVCADVVPAAPAQETKTVESVMPAGCRIEARTDVGCVRASNQDALINSWPVIGVADGMGGHNGGEVASAMCRDLLLEMLSGREPDEDVLRAAVSAVNRRILQRAEKDEKLSGMGTTLSFLWIGEKKLLLGHVGDSRIYRFRDDTLSQLSMDHSLVGEMVRQGLLTPDQAETHPMRNIITRAIGTDDTVETDTDIWERKPGDLYLICSDGLHGMVHEDRMSEIIRTESDLKTVADTLLSEALANGGRDNVSFVLFRDGEVAE